MTKSYLEEPIMDVWDIEKTIQREQTARCVWVACLDFTEDLRGTLGVIAQYNIGQFGVHYRYLLPYSEQAVLQIEAFNKQVSFWEKESKKRGSVAFYMSAEPVFLDAGKFDLLSLYSSVGRARLAMYDPEDLHGTHHLLIGDITNIVMPRHPKGMRRNQNTVGRLQRFIRLTESAVLRIPEDAPSLILPGWAV